MLFNPWESFDYEFEHDETFASISDVLYWTSSNITWALDEDVHQEEEYWDSPKQVYDSRKGDCDGFSLLVGYLIWKDVGLSDVYIVFLKNPDPAKQSTENHIIIKAGDRYYEPQFDGWQVDHPEWCDPTMGWEAEFVFPIREALWSAVNAHKGYPATWYDSCMERMRR
jgi:hypothetical protein